MITLQDIRDARQRIEPYIRRTPLEKNSTWE
jgi:threonine dehydratase